MVVTTRGAARKSGGPIQNTTMIIKQNTTTSTINPAKDDTSSNEQSSSNGEDNDDSGDSGNSSDEDLSSDEENTDNEEDEDSDTDQDDDDDLNELLKKAQLSLHATQNEIVKLGDNISKNNEVIQLPKLQPGISVDDELYIKANKGQIAKLSAQVVAVVDTDDSDQAANNKALVTLHKIKQETKPLTRKERQQEREKTTGKGWFDMPLAEVTPEIKRDLQILKMRHVLDRKRHYKKMGKGPDPKYFQMGTVIEGATEFFSSRINKKDRKRTFAEELISNDEHTSYYNRKYMESQERRFAGGKKHFKKLKAKRS